MDQIDVGDSWMLERLGELKTETLKLNRAGSKGDRIVMRGELLRRALFVILNNTLQRRGVQLQFGIPEKLIALLHFFSPGELWKRIGGGIGMTTAATKLVNLLGGGFRGQRRQGRFKRFRRRRPVLGEDKNPHSEKK